MTNFAEPTMIIQNLRDVHVPNERDDEVKKHLYRLFVVDEDGDPTPEPCRFTSGRETRGVAVIEEAGGGKTTAIRTVLKEAEFLADDPETGCPRYLEIEVPSPATLKSVGLAILEKTGMEGVSSNAREWEIWKAVRARLGVLGVSVLWLDEAQDLILARNANDTENTLRMIKSLMQGEHAVIPILSGTQRLAEVTALDPQVSRRFTKIRPMGLQHGIDEGNLGHLIESYCSEAGIEARLEGDILARLITGSRHRFGRAIEMIINAIECAVWEGAKFLTPNHFAEAWAMHEGCEPKNNIFYSENWVSIELDKGAEEYEAARTKRQKKKLERA